MYFHFSINISPLEKGIGPSFEHNQGCFMPCLTEIGPVVLEEKGFFKFFNVFLLFRKYLLLKKGVTLHLKYLESLNLRMPGLVEIGPVVQEKKIF